VVRHSSAGLVVVWNLRRRNPWDSSNALVRSLPCVSGREPPRQADPGFYNATHGSAVERTEGRLQVPRRSGASRRRSWPWPETKLERKARELSVDGEDLRWWLRVEIERRRGETYAQVPGEPRRDCRSIVLRRRGPECVSARRCAGHQS
jgi:hypothetical protein